MFVSVYRIRREVQQHLWISNDFGLELISLDGLRDYEYSKEALNVEKISVVKSINDHILWVGTNEGILKINSNVVFIPNLFTFYLNIRAINSL